MKSGDYMKKDGKLFQVTEIIADDEIRFCDEGILNFNALKTKIVQAKNLSE